MLIEELGMSAKTTLCLKQAGIATVGELEKADLFKVRNLGRKSLEEILQKLKTISGKLERYDIIPMECFHKFMKYGYDTVDRIAGLKSRDIIRILEYNEDDYRTVVTNMYKNGFELREYQRGKYDSFDEYVNEKVKEFINIDIATLISDEKIIRFLKEKKIESISGLKKYDVNDLIGLGMCRRDVKELKYQLAHSRCPLKNDRIERCALCGELGAYVSEKEQENEVYCFECKSRIERMANKKGINISVNEPEYTQFSSGKKGFYIMTNISNVSRKVVNVRVADLYLVSIGRKWIADSTLEGYSFSKEEILPDTLKSVAKIWTSGQWSYRELDEKDYLIVEIIVNEKQKQIFKFIYLNKRWVEFDFYATKVD